MSNATLERTVDHGSTAIPDKHLDPDRELADHFRLIDLEHNEHGEPGTKMGAHETAGTFHVGGLCERSTGGPPKGMLRHTSPLLKGVALDWDPQVLHVHGLYTHVAHDAIAGRSPRRGTIAGHFEVIATGTLLAVNVADPINHQHEGDPPALARQVAECWHEHDELNARIAKHQLERGYDVITNADANDHTATFAPLQRATATLHHDDAIAYGGTRIRLNSCHARAFGSPGHESDHRLFLAAFTITATTTNRSTK